MTRCVVARRCTLSLSKNTNHSPFRIFQNNLICCAAVLLPCPFITSGSATWRHVHILKVKLMHNARHTPIIIVTPRLLVNQNLIFPVVKYLHVRVKGAQMNGITTYNRNRSRLLLDFTIFLILGAWQLVFGLNSKTLVDGLHLQRGNWGLRSCLDFLCGVAVNKIRHRGIVVTSNSTVCDAWVSSCSNAIHCSFTFFCIAAFRSPPPPPPSPAPMSPFLEDSSFFKKRSLIYGEMLG